MQTEVELGGHWSTPGGLIGYTRDSSILKENEKTRIAMQPDKNHAVQQLLALLPTRPDVAFLRTDPPFIMRFLRAKKFRVGDAFLMLCRYFEYRQRHRELFRGMTIAGGGTGEEESGTNNVQAALLDGIPGVLAERDQLGRPIVIILASNWNFNSYDVNVIYKATLLTLERLVEDEAVQSNGVVAIIDWSSFPARHTTSLKPKVLRMMLDGLQDSFPLRLGALHIVYQPWYVEACLSLAKPFLKEKLRSKVYIHGNNLSALHAQVPPRLLPAELGGEGGEYHAQTWASTMLSAKTVSQSTTSLASNSSLNASNASLGPTPVTESSKNLSSVTQGNNKFVFSDSQFSSSTSLSSSRTSLSSSSTSTLSSGIGNRLSATFSSLTAPWDHLSPPTSNTKTDVTSVSTVDQSTSSSVLIEQSDKKDDQLDEDEEEGLTSSR